MTQPLHLRVYRLPVPVVWLLLGAGLVAGLVAWQHQFSRGMVTTGMRDVVPWGVYTVAYLFFVALATGAVAMACAGVLGRSSPPRPLVHAGLGTSVGGLVAAVFAFLVNLDRPSRVYNILLHPNWSSPVVWSLYAVLATLVLSVALLIVLRQQPGRRRSRTARALALAGVVAAPVTAVATVGIFAFQRSRPAWNGGLTVPMFLVTAGLAGAAAVILAARSTQPELALADSSRTKGWLTTVMVALLATELVVTAINYLTAVRSSPVQWAAMQIVLAGGGWSWLFWAEWIAGGLLPLVLLTVPAVRSRAYALEAAAALALSGVITSYIAFVPGGLASPRITLPPGMAVGTGRTAATSFQATGFYHPTLTEYGILVGLACAFLAVAGALLRRHRARTGDVR